ncbi:hypothetical protein B0J14DRAFT_113972 [Halenospora varia]|nr:hypothetical protein B0J14DRAFT_113972 [Halenospora varia]
MFEGLSIAPPISSAPAAVCQIHTLSPISKTTLPTNPLQNPNEHNVDPSSSNNPRSIDQPASIFTPDTQPPGDLQVAIHQGGRGVKRPWDEDELSQLTTQGTQSLNTRGIPSAPEAVHRIHPSSTNLSQNLNNVDLSSNTIPQPNKSQIIMPDTLLSETHQRDEIRSQATVVSIFYVYPKYPLVCPNSHSPSVKAVKQGLLLFLRGY